MLFKQVVGQQAAKQGLLIMWNTGHFPHALLITGREGTGGLPLALALTQYIFCEQKLADDACGQCVACRKVEKLEHADVHMSFPSVSPKPGTKAMSRHYIQEFREFISQTAYSNTYDWLQFINAENKQGNITAEECREIIDVLNLKSYEGGKKVQIIWRPEYLGKEGNILLKLIEEPPADTILLFVAENTEDILQTILSRTQIIRLPPVLTTDIADALVSRALVASREAAMQIANMADGSYAEAVRLVRHAENDLFPDVRNWFNALFRNNGIEIAKFSDEWSKAGREQQKNFLKYNIQLLEHAVRVRYVDGYRPALPAQEAEFVGKLGAMPLPVSVFANMVDELTHTIYHIGRNAHSKTQLHALSVKLVYLVQNKKIPAI